MNPIGLEVLESQLDPIIPQCILEVFLGKEKQIPNNQLNHNITINHTLRELFIKSVHAQSRGIGGFRMQIYATLCLRNLAFGLDPSL